MSRNRVAWIVMAAAAALVASAPEARADREVGLANLLGRMGDAVRWEKPNPSNGDNEIQEMRERCRAALVEAKKEGVKGSDKLTSSSFGVHPKAVKVGDQYAVKFSDAAWFCDDLDKRLDYWDMIQQIENGIQAAQRTKEGLSDERKRTVEGHEVEYWYAAGKRCTSALEKQLAAGLSPDTEIDAKGTKVKLSEAGPVCAALTTYADLLEAAFQVRFEELAVKYKEVGIGGERLELFVYYDPMEWYLPGCKRSTADPKQMKKAKKLFQWLTDSDGVITIRKFAFKGDKYKITEKTYLLEKKAYKGCK